MMFPDRPMIASLTTPFSASIAQLPLAIYLEIVAHLQQLPGLQISLLPQTDATFDYLQSQVGGITIDWSQAPAAEQTRASQILEYYSHRYGQWIIA
jgi:hypothetical protein